jgi:Uma2 family endonuclease
MRFVVEVLAALSDPRLTMTEGRRHKKAKSRAVDMLGLHFGAMGRVVYVAEDMSVLYPGEPGFTPDVLVVFDVPQPDDDPRMDWIVADEGRGPDFVLEVLHRVNRKKDLEENVERYARLGIPEYFIYDRLHQRIHGHRLPPGAKRYQRVVPQAGRYTSNVLGLDMAIEQGSLRFYQGMAELFGSEDLIGRLRGMVQDLEARNDEAEAAAEEARAAAEAARIAAEEARSAMRGAILAIAESRGISCSDEARARLSACDDLAVLQRWTVRAATAGSLDEAIAEGR